MNPTFLKDTELPVNKAEFFSEELAVFQAMGLDYVSIGKVFPQGAVYSFFSHPEWGQFYQDHKFFLQDPCVHSLYKTINLLASWKYFNRGSLVMETRREMCAIKDGLSLYDRMGPNSSLILGVASSDPKVVNRILDSQGDLTRIFCIKNIIAQKCSDPNFYEKFFKPYDQSKSS